MVVHLGEIICCSIDHIRNGLLILIALVTGLRLKELSILKFDDIYNDYENKWNIKIKRFKTANDPNYQGEKNEIPLPAFVGQAVQNYKSLRDFRKFMKKGLLFQSLKTNLETKLLDRMIKRATFIIAEILKLDGLHIHRFRKTIAEILINRSERNIDIIRLLFGHKSYAMTLRYIARNPFMVESIVEAMAQTCCETLKRSYHAVKNGEYSGVAADELAKSIKLKHNEFSGSMLHQSLMTLCYRYDKIRTTSYLFSIQYLEHFAL